MRDAAPGTCGGRTVLVVDDDDDLRESIEVVLASRGHSVATAADGEEALAWLQRQTPDNPCLVLLDLMMPRMNGFELRARMIADPGLAAIPVVIITGAGLLADNSSGALQTEVLRKPIEPSTLLRAVGKFCSTVTHAGGP
jgi:two-component system chemotaxis response regulator CheY